MLNTARPNDGAPGKKMHGRGFGASGQSAGRRFCRIGYVAGRVGLFLAVAASVGFADTTTSRISLPIEILGADGATVRRSVALYARDVEQVHSLWLQIHGLRYKEQATRG